MTIKGEQLIAWSEMLGGAIGLVVLLPIAAYEHVVPLSAIYYVSSALGFVLSIVAGWRLFRRQVGGRELSLVVQVLQVLQVTALGWSIQYAAGLQVLVKIERGMFMVSPGANAGMWFGPTYSPLPWMVAVNLFALWASVHLVRALRRANMMVGPMPEVTGTLTPPSPMRPA